MEAVMVQPRIVEMIGIGYRAGRRFTLNEVLQQIMVRRLMQVHVNRSIPKWIRTEALYYATRLRTKSLFGGGSKGDTWENDGLKLWFNATAIANMADNASSSPFTSLYFALHTADPGETGDQTTSETSYTLYARTAVARTSGGFTVTNNSVSPAAAVTFPAGSGGSGTITHFSVGTAVSGAGKLMYSGTCSPNVTVGNGITPQLTTATAITED